MTDNDGSGNLADRLICATYNIHRCIGTDGQQDRHRLRAVIAALDAQILALQEVELLDGSPDVLEFLGAGAGYRAIFGRTMRHSAGQYGNALLTRLPLLATHQLDLSVPGEEPRGAIRVLLQHIRNPSDDWRAEVTLLMGDLNEWFLWGRPLRWLRRYFGSLPQPATFPARRPVFALDRIWVEPRELLVSVKTFRDAPARLASDHLPLLARLEAD
jgi:endonuclease/exonuclease/phosphatase family metal-dependent hydrolase